MERDKKRIEIVPMKRGKCHCRTDVEETIRHVICDRWLSRLLFFDQALCRKATSKANNCRSADGKSAFHSIGIHDHKPPNFCVMSWAPFANRHLTSQI